MSASSKLTPWLMWVLSVCFYFYQFIIRVATSNMRDQLTLEFNLTASDYGLFASYWIVSYALLQIPIGIALDKWGVRKVFTVSAFLCGVGTLITASTENYAWLCFARLLIGAGSAPAFIGTFKISSEWFKPSLLPILVGVISAIGVLGATLAGAPMVILQESIGWRTIFYTLSAIAFALSLIYSLVLREKKLSSTLSLGEIKKQLLHLITEPQIWLLGTIGFLLYTPVSVLADLWGPSFMRAVYGYNAIDSAIASSFIFYGNAVGSFLAGWVFLKFTTNKHFFASFMTLAGIMMSVIIWVDISNFWILCCALFALGCMVGAENLVFPLGARYAAEGFQGLSASVINFLVMVGAIALQPGIGVIMDVLWDGTIDNALPVYSIDQYRWGLSALIGSLVLGLMLSFGVKGKTLPAA
jgi:predicted MFS family arabinose efflux permease